MEADRRSSLHPLPLRRIFLRGLTLQARIGIHSHEQGRTQPIRVSVMVAMPDDSVVAASRPAPAQGEGLARTIDYGALADAVRRLVASGHVGLVETLAERILEVAMEDDRVREAEVTVEKLDAIGDGAVAGVQLERRR